jgi:F0F1-type ATP synthase delta subunit
MINKINKERRRSMNDRNIDVRTISKLKRKQLKDIRSVMYRKRNSKM